MNVADLPVAALAAILAVSAGAVWVSGETLARTADALSTRFGLGQALGGLLLLAVATNLPEAAIVASAALRGDMSMAVGNLLGGVAAQTLVLVAIDRWGVRGGVPLMTQAASPALAVEALLVIAVLALVGIGRQLAPATTIGPLSAGDLLLPAVWLAGVVAIGRMRSPLGATEPAATRPAGTTRAAAAAFAVASLVTMAGGVGLEVAGDALAKRLGIGGVLFGATVLAAATSLPELSTGIAAARAGERELAVSDILGGNAVLPVMLVMASLLAWRSAFADIDPISLLLCGLGIVMTAVVATAGAIRSPRRVLGVGAEGIVLIAAYALGIAAIAMTKID